MFLARRMVVPIQALRPGARASATAICPSHIAIRPATNLRRWPTSSTTWPGVCRKSYAGLEQKVELRTHEVQTRSRELAQSVAGATCPRGGDASSSSTLDLETVLSTIVAKAVQLSGTEAGSIYVSDPTTHEFHQRATHGMSKELIAAAQPSRRRARREDDRGRGGTTNPCASCRPQGDAAFTADEHSAAGGLSRVAGRPAARP